MIDATISRGDEKVRQVTAYSVGEEGLIARPIHMSFKGEGMKHIHVRFSLEEANTFCEDLAKLIILNEAKR
jgi:hypothetical protein